MGKIETIWTEEIKEGDFIAPYVKILDKNGNEITKVISYNTLTKRVVRYKTDHKGKVVTMALLVNPIKYRLETETFIADGSYLVFKVKDEIEKDKN